MRYFVSFSRFLGIAFLLGTFGGGMVASGIYLYLAPSLPDVEQLRTTQLQVPLRIYSSDQKLIAEFGEKRRIPIHIEDVPELFKYAFIAAEDNRFYSHQGVDIKGLLRAAVQLATTGSIQSGGSTITMQVAKNFFLSRDRTFTRKFSEILLSLQIERELSKDEILELYFNKIYLGNRAYGIGAAAQVYYGLPFNQLSLAQMAMIAGLPKAPSKYNPLANWERSKQRRDWILSRMLELGYISKDQYNEAIAAPKTASYHGAKTELSAPYLAELARKEMVERYGESAYDNGYVVTLTAVSTLQHKAQTALASGLETYDRRHGYRGPITQIQLTDETSPETLIDILKQYPEYNGLRTAVVINSTEQEAKIILSDGTTGTLPLEGVQWARQYLDVNKKGPEIRHVNEVLNTGDIIYIRRTDNESGERLVLAQIPEVQGSIVSLDHDTGAILALAGGYSFYQSKYNRALQAKRQPGSNFKPFIYLSALENGATAATTINDAPIVYDDAQLESAWRPQNSSGKFFGPTRLRTALYKSRNLVSIRLLKRTGIEQTLRYAQRFGFDTDSLPKDLSLALGSAGIAPIDIARGYAILANGGYRITPFLIQRIEDSEGNTLFEALPAVACPHCRDIPLPEGYTELPAYLQRISQLERNGINPAPRVADPRTIYIMHSILRDVIRKGTGRKARVLGRQDIAGKTGTTNEQVDAWFSGFGGGIETTVWVGFDQPTTLGRREYGAVAALPIWIDYMKTALDGRPETFMPRPEGIVTVKINKKTGLRTDASDPDAIFEIFREEYIPEKQPAPPSPIDPPIENSETETGTLPQDIF